MNFCWNMSATNALNTANKFNKLLCKAHLQTEYAKINKADRTNRNEINIMEYGLHDGRISCYVGVSAWTVSFYQTIS